MHAVSTVTSRGQVTLPKEVRNFLQSRTIEFEIRGQEVILRPVKSVGGSLAKYATTYDPLASVREQVWNEVVNDKT